MTTQVSLTESEATKVKALVNLFGREIDVLKDDEKYVLLMEFLKRYRIVMEKLHDKFNDAGKATS